MWFKGHVMSWYSVRLLIKDCVRRVSKSQMVSFGAGKQTKVSEWMSKSKTCCLPGFPADMPSSPNSGAGICSSKPEDNRSKCIRGNKKLFELTHNYRSFHWFLLMSTNLFIASDLTRIRYIRIDVFNYIITLCDVCIHIRLFE